MGFEVERIVSDQGHYGHFECTLCQRLVDLDCLVTTACSHCFCRRCWLAWLNQKKTSPPEKRCPTCNENLHQDGLRTGKTSVLVQPLQLCQPLAHRVLGHTKVSCPLSSFHCGWEGNYSDVRDHLLTSTAHVTLKESRKSLNKAKG